MNFLKSFYKIRFLFQSKKELEKGILASLCLSVLRPSVVTHMKQLLFQWRGLYETFLN